MSNTYLPPPKGPHPGAFFVPSAHLTQFLIPSSVELTQFLQPPTAELSQFLTPPSVKLTQFLRRYAIL